MIVTIRQLKLIHYFYFCMGIFGLANCFYMELGSVLSWLFLLFYVANSGISWFIAFEARRRMRAYVVVNSVRFFAYHTTLSVITVALSAGYWMLEAVPGTGLLITVLMGNYFVIFLAGIWYVLSRTDLARSLFIVYDNRLFQKSREFILRIRRGYWHLFGRKLITEQTLIDYKAGSISEVDENMLLAWKNRNKLRFCIECMGRIELALAGSILRSLSEKLESVRFMAPVHGNPRLITDTEKEIRSRTHDIEEFEKEFYKVSEGQAQI